MSSINHNNDELDKRLVNSLLKSRIPSINQLKHIEKVASKKEMIALRVGLFSLAGCILYIFIAFFIGHVEKRSASGGEYIEGLVGSPKYINPIYSSLRDVDNDIASLVFSSLFKKSREGGMVPDLAESYVRGEDGLTYTVVIKDGVKWHNSEDEVTIDDVIYTFQLIKDANYQSPLRVSFSGVEIERVDEKTIKFILSQRYSGFLDLLVFGILPQDIWYQIPPNSFGLAELNLKPIGSGMYKFKSLAKDKSGALKLYSLEYNEDYYGDEPYVRDIGFKFYPNFEEAIAALSAHAVDGISYLPPSAKDNMVAPELWNYYDLDLSQSTAIFFNLEKNKYLAEKNVRVALAYAINKDAVISALNSNYKVVDGPILPSNFAYNEEINKYEFDLRKAAELLEIGGWQLEEIGQEELLLAVKEDVVGDEEGGGESVSKVANGTEQDIKMLLGEGSWLGKKVSGEKEYLVVNLTTVDTPENVAVVNIIKQGWEAIGIKTIIQVVPANQLHTNLVGSRDFESLFYGQVFSDDPDIYAYWHSSQIGKNGLNIAGFNNKEVDKLLEDARGLLDRDERIVKYKRVQQIISEELPAIYLYSPTYTYVQNKKIKGFNVLSIQKPGERFSNIKDWYILTERKFSW